MNSPIKKTYNRNRSLVINLFLSEHNSWGDCQNYSNKLFKSLNTLLPAFGRAFISVQTFIDPLHKSFKNEIVLVKRASVKKTHESKRKLHEKVFKKYVQSNGMERVRVWSVPVMFL